LTSTRPGPLGPGRTISMKKLIAILILCALALLLGIWAGRTLVHDGLESFEGRPPEAAVARRALEMAHW